MILSDLKPEQVLFTHYRLTELLGQDNYTAFWRGVDEKSRREVIIHFLPPFVKEDSRAVQELRRVGWMVVELRHANIGRCHELLEDVDYTAIASEHMNGNSIAEIREATEGGRFEVDEVRELLRQVLSGLHYAHVEKNVVHAGLTPSDIRVNDRGGVKIFGFQTSAVLFDALVRKGFEEWDATAVPYYSPQRWNGDAATELDDIYSVGVILYELLTGHQPFIDHGVVQISDQIPGMAEMRQRDGDPGQPIPEEWEIAVTACMSEDPDARPHSIEELAFRLGLDLNASPGSSKPEVEEIAPRRHIPADRFDLDESSEDSDETFTPSLPLNLIGGLIGAIAVCFIVFWFIERRNEQIEQERAAAERQANEEFLDLLNPIDVADTPTVATNHLEQLTHTFTNVPPGLATSKILPTASGGWMLLGRTQTGETEQLQIIRVTSTGSVAPGGGVSLGLTGEIHDAIAQPDGRLLVAGSLADESGASISLARFLPDGTRDSAFSPAIDGPVRAIALQPDGSLIVGGEFASAAGSTTANIARLTRSGMADPTFTLPTGTDGPVNSVVSLTDGRLIVAGRFTTIGGVRRASMARLTPDGQVDLTFAVGVGPSGAIESVLELPDGKLLVAGVFTTFNGTPAGRIVRLEPNGRVDTGFRLAVGPDRAVTSIAVAPTGAIAIGGPFERINERPVGRFALLRPNGSLDRSLNTGRGFNDTVQDVAFDSNGNVLIAGAFSAVNGIPRRGIAEFNLSATTDAPPAETMIANDDSSIALDPGFAIGTGVQGRVNAIEIQRDGRIWIGGEFSSVGGQPAGSIALLGPNGALLPGAGVSLEGAVRDIAVQIDNKALVAGSFTVPGSTSANLVRMNEDGSVDTTFSDAVEIDGPVNAVGIEIDGTVVIAGEFTKVNGSTRRGVAKLTSSGDLRTDFDPLNGASQPIHALHVETDGSVLIAGEFLRFNGLTRRFIARLKPNGALDSDFRPDTRIAFPIHALAVQTDGRILIGGGDESAAPTGNIARLHPTGALDLSFAPNGGANKGVRSIAILRDRRIAVGGHFDLIDRANRSNLAILNPNGRVDPQSDPGSLATGGVQTIAIQLDGKLLIGGVFNRMSGAAGNGVMRTDGIR